MLVVCWFSAGVSSAVACKIAGQVDRIIYTHIDDAHPDTLRFVQDCQRWFGQPVEILQSPLRSVEIACRQVRYVNGPRGAPCTNLLKRRVRKQWEMDNWHLAPFTYIWGFDVSEGRRSLRICEAMPGIVHKFPLVERGISKPQAHGILRKAGIRRPMMYDLGYQNNNCVGCVKGGAAYWNQIRQDFPEVFEARARMEREIGGTSLKGRIFLDSLDPNAGRGKPPIVEDCGIFCEINEE